MWKQAGVGPLLTLVLVGGVEAKKCGQGGKGKKKDRKGPVAMDFIPENIIDELHQALVGDPYKLKALQEKRNLTRETIDRYRLGYSDFRKRISIPVLNEQGKCINIRLWSGQAEFKMESWGKGYGSTTIFGLELLQDYPLDEDLIIAEGEIDTEQKDSTKIKEGFNKWFTWFTWFRRFR